MKKLRKDPYQCQKNSKSKKNPYKNLREPRSTIEVSHSNSIQRIRKTEWNINVDEQIKPKMKLDLNCREKIKKTKTRKHITSDKSNTTSQLFMCKYPIYIDSLPNTCENPLPINRLIQVPNWTNPNLNLVWSHCSDRHQRKRIISTRYQQHPQKAAQHLLDQESHCHQLDDGNPLWFRQQKIDFCCFRQITRSLFSPIWAHTLGRVTKISSYCHVHC